MQEKRLAKLEAGLEGAEKVLAWLHARQQQGGFVETATRRIETSGASVRLPDIKDVESEFIFECWLACNKRVLELEADCLQKGLMSLSLARFLRAENISPNDTSPPSPLTPGGTLLATASGTVTTPTINTDFTTWVYSDPLNTWCVNCLDFVYEQVWQPSNHFLSG